MVYNGIDVDRYAQPSNGTLRSLLGVPPGTPIVFTASRAQPYKGIPVLMEAAAALAARRDAVHVAYCGDGPALKAFRRAAADRALTNFHLLGRRDDVPRLLPDATVAVVPPVWEEAFGLTVVEAMAAGVPVVATRVGAIPELVQDGENGLLVPPGDAPALVGAVERVLGDDALRARLVARGRATVRERFTIARAVDDLYAIVAELLAT
jgi:glycosyltransferase involved in cell wall biosynthesis